MLASPATVLRVKELSVRFSHSARVMIVLALACKPALSSDEVPTQMRTLRDGPFRYNAPDAFCKLRTQVWISSLAH